MFILQSLSFFFSTSFKFCEFMPDRPKIRKENMEQAKRLKLINGGITDISEK